MKYVFNSKGENAICRLWKERQYCFRVYKGNVHFIFRFFLFLFVLLTAQWALASTITKWPLLGEEFSLAYIFTCTFCKPSQGCSHTHTLSLSTWVFISLKLSRKKKTTQGLLSFFYSITSRLLYKETFGDEKY